MRTRQSFAVGTLGLLFLSTLSSASPLRIEARNSGGLEGKWALPEKPLNPMANPPGLTYSPTVPNGQGFAREVEPNGTSGTATPIVLTGGAAVVQANIFPNADVDYFSFTGSAGDRVYAATMTSWSSNGSSDSQLDVLDTDGATSLEFDDDNGVFGGLSSSIAGVTLPGNGTYFLRVKHFSATSQLRPYRLYLQVRSGAPTPETEPNDTLPGQALPAGGWVSGTTSATTDADLYSLALNAGDTVFVSLDLDPERDTVEWNGQLGLGLFNGFFLTANDAGAVGPDSEAYFMTAQAGGTYSVLVNLPTGGTTFGTYHLSVTVFPATDEGVNCTTYTSTDVPQVIPTGPGSVSSTLTVPGNPRIADLDVQVQLDHTNMPDLDVHLISPAGNDNGLFTDIGSNTQTAMNLTLDDEAGLPAGLYTVVSGEVFAPELAYRLDWFDGEDAGGTWTLQIRDDLAANGGNLTAWSIRICEPPPPAACAPGFVPTTVFTTDFEAGDAGFTHSGTADEWERGLPSFVPITTCNSGVNCWVTDLDNTYNVSSNQDLLSPNINLSGLQPPVVISWAQRYQIESASFDHAFVDAQEAGGANPVRLFEWTGATMTDTVGSPAVTIQESAGWGQFSRRADSLAGLNSELRFHLDTDTSVNLAGLAIDDVSVTACRPAVSDYTITKTDGVTTAVPGGSVTYTIVATNLGPDPSNGATVSDTFPGTLSCTWTCTASPGSSCTAGPVAGNINDPVNLLANGTATYTATCNISPAATGSLSNTATIAGSGDPNPNNNSALDTDTLTPQADLAITKTDGLTTAAPGQGTTYTIVASNPGPSNAPGSTVADTFPGAYTGVSWTCSGSGATCTGAGAGNINDVVNLPAGGSVTYTVSGTISGAFLGNLSNTATVAAPGGVADGNQSNNSAIDNTNVVSPASLSATKTVSGDFSEGGTIYYEIIVSNAGPGTQFDNPGDEFDDTLPAGLTLVNVTANNGTPGSVGNTATWNGSIPAAGSVTITIEATIDAGTAGQTIANQGTIQFDADGDGTNESSGVTDDPAVGGATDPTEIVVGESGPDQSILEIPTLGPGALAGLAIALALLGLAILRRRRTA